MVVGRYELTEVQWRRINVLLPGRAGMVGRPAADNRLFVQGVLWILRSGMRWQDMPERYGKYKSVHKRFTRSAAAGVWDRVFADLLKDGGNRSVMIDSSVVRAHQQAATPEKRDQESALRRSRGGLTTKIHLLANSLGLPLCFVLTGGQANDCTQALPLLGDRRPIAVLADKGYDTDPILNHLAERGIEAVIPPRRMRLVQRSFNETLYQQRSRIERAFAHLKQFRRLATRFDKLKQNFQATVTLTGCWRWLAQLVDTP